MMLCIRKYGLWLKTSSWLMPAQLVLLVFAFGASPAIADPVVKVTWQDVVQLVEQHPAIAAANFTVEAARGGMAAARAVPNPSAEGTIGKGSALVGDESRLEWGVALTVPLEWIARRGASVRVARAGVEVAEAEGQVLRRDVELQLRELFWNLAGQQAGVASLQELESQTLALVEMVGKRVEKGEARPVEVVRVEIELEKVRNDLEAARTLLAAGQAEIGLWFGGSTGAIIEVVADFDTLPVAVDRDAALADARANNPQLAAVRAGTQSLQAEIDVEKVARFPAFSVTGFTDYELDKFAFGLKVGIDLPIWNWNSGRINQAKARLAAGQKLAEVSALELDSAVLQAHAACQSSSQTATRLKNNVVPRSESAASQIEKSYQFGEASLLEVIDARRTVLESRRNYIAALAQAQIDCSRLGSLVAKEPR